MTHTAQATGSSSACQTHEDEARLLVELLRTSRLSVLYAEAGTDKTAFLSSELMPLLCRRAGDHVVPLASRASGVVVPFPDRRSRSGRSSKRRREVVVHCGGWSDAPLATLRESLLMAVAADPKEAQNPSARLSDVLEELGQRFDAGFIVLLDRFEALFEDPANHVEVDQFLDELAEAIHHGSSSANFLIALAEEERPRLTRLRTRMPGFDDFSVKLARRRDVAEDVVPLALQKLVVPAVVDVLPVLTETLIVSDGGAKPPRTAQLGAPLPDLRFERKTKRVASPRKAIKTEDVHAMIREALARVARSAAAGPVSVATRCESVSTDTDPYATQAQAREGRVGSTGRGTPALLPRSAISQSESLASRTLTRRNSLTEAIERMERRLAASAGDDSRC